MSTNKQIENLLQKRMDRKGFLKHVGIGVLALTGLTSVVKLLQGNQQQQNGGYGSSVYGGGKSGTNKTS